MSLLSESEDWQDAIQIHADMGPTPPKSWLVPGFLAFDEISAIFGEPGSGKSALATDIACRLAAGIEWDGTSNGRPFNVLYIATERAGQVRRRVDAFCREHNVGPFDGLAIYDGPIDLSEPSDDLSEIVTAAGRKVGGAWPALVVIDTLAAAMEKPDSDTTATAAVVRNLLTASRENEGAHLLLVHHVPLNGERRLRGGHLTGAVDLTMHVARKNGAFVAQVIKDNDSPEDGRLRLDFTLKNVEWETKPEWETEPQAVSAPVVVPCDPPKATSLPDAKGTPALPKAQRVTFEALVIATKDGPVPAAVWRAAFDALPANTARSANARKAAFYRATKALLKGGQVQEIGGLYSTTLG